MREKKMKEMDACFLISLPSFESSPSLVNAGPFGWSPLVFFIEQQERGVSFGNADTLCQLNICCDECDVIFYSIIFQTIHMYIYIRETREKRGKWALGIIDTDTLIGGRVTHDNSLSRDTLFIVLRKMCHWYRVHLSICTVRWKKLVWVILSD